jgi:membrane protease YdiL (CAAX protease family)
VAGGGWRRFIAGGMVLILASLSSQAVRLSDDRKLILLQVTLGPVLEEILFRGYLFALLLWSFRRLWKSQYSTLAVPIAAVVFAVVHLSQPGTTWLQMACIMSTGALYGVVRYASGSAAPAAAAHAAYNLALYAISIALNFLSGRG